jgi:hypothetical protein
MQPRTKIRLEAIRQVQCALDELPEYCVEEVSKAEAIRRLLPQILAMQSKGYRLEAIARMLTNNGVPVSVMTLQKYLSQAKSSTAHKKLRRPAEHREGASLTLSGNAARDGAAINRPGKSKAIRAVVPTSSRTRAVNPDKISPSTPSDRGSVFAGRKDSDEI